MRQLAIREIGQGYNEQDELEIRCFNKKWTNGRMELENNHRYFGSDRELSQNINFADNEDQIAIFH